MNYAEGGHLFAKLHYSGIHMAAYITCNKLDWLDQFGAHYVARTVVILLSSEFLPARGFVSVRGKQWCRSSRILALPPSLLPPCVNSAKCGGSQSWETMTTLDTMPCSRNTQWHYDPATHPRRLMLFLNWWPSTVCIDFFIVIGADYEVRRRRYCVQFVMVCK